MGCDGHLTIKRVGDGQHQGRADLSFICGEGSKALSGFTCERCGKDLKPDCKSWRCEYVRQARAFCERFERSSMSDFIPGNQPTESS